MTTIFKYELVNKDMQKVTMPRLAKILSVQVQSETICIWALVDPHNDTEERVFEIFGTGHRIPVDMGVGRNYLSTCQLLNGAFVGHVFERLN